MVLVVYRKTKLTGDGKSFSDASRKTKTLEEVKILC